MKKISAMSASLLAALLLVSCGGAPENGPAPAGNDSAAAASDGTAAAETEYSRLDELKTDAFSGRTFTILDANDYPGSNLISPGPEMTGDIINDNLYERDMAIEELFGIDINYIQFAPAADGCKSMKQAAQAGDDAYQLCISTLLGGSLADSATGHVLRNLCDIGEISLKEPWWSPLMYDQLRLYGRMYYTSGDLSPMRFTLPSCIYLNQKLLGDYGIDGDYYALADDGKWTLDRFYEITVPYDQDLNGDGKMHMSDDFFGLANADHVLSANQFIVGAGVGLSTVDEDGIHVDLGSERTAAVIEKLKPIVSGKKYADQNDIYKLAFMEDRAIAVMHTLSISKSTLRSMESDYYIMPMPKFDELQKDYRSFINAWSNAFIGIPVTADPVYSGTVTEALCWHSYKNLRAGMCNLLLKEKSARDAGSQRMIDILLEAQYIDFNGLYDFGGTTSVLQKALFGNGELVSGIEKAAEKTRKAIESLETEWNA